MKKAFLIMILLSSQLMLFSQEVTEENYQKITNAIWEEFELRMKDLSKTYELHPDKKDSLIIVANKIEKIADKKNYEAALKFAPLPNGLKRLYMCRLNIPKDTLCSVFESLPNEVQKSEYGESLLLHLKMDQIKEGDQCADVQAIDSNGEKFHLSDLKGENILLLYGGLGCMGEEGRNYLTKYIDDVGHKNLNIVVYNSCSDLEELKEIKTKYELNFIYISDFLKDQSPFKIRYGAQSTPTCYFINKNGKIIIKSIGLPEERLERLKDNLI